MRLARQHALTLEPTQPAEQSACFPRSDARTSEMSILEVLSNRGLSKAFRVALSHGLTDVTGSEVRNHVNPTRLSLSI